MTSNVPVENNHEGDDSNKNDTASTNGDDAIIDDQGDELVGNILTLTQDVVDEFETTLEMVGDKPFLDSCESAFHILILVDYGC